jgi:hypothetical protein
MSREQSSPSLSGCQEYRQLGQRLNVYWSSLLNKPGGISLWHQEEDQYLSLGRNKVHTINQDQGEERLVHRARRRAKRRRLIVGSAVVFMIGGAYSSSKLSQQEVQQVEQHTDKSAEDLTEEEMEAALDDLGIQDQELTDKDEAAINPDAV